MFPAVIAGSSGCAQIVKRRESRRCHSLVLLKYLFIEFASAMAREVERPASSGVKLEELRFSLRHRAN
jgi:hypothetical protein